MELFDPKEFMQNLELKEAMYLMSKGNLPSPEEISQIVEKILPKETEAVQILLQVLSDRLKVVTSAWGNLEIFPSPVYLRDATARTKGFQLHRTINDLDLEFTFTEAEGGLYLSVHANPAKGLSCDLIQDEDVVETLGNLETQSMFDSPITLHFSPEIRIYSKSKEFGKFHFLLQS